MPPTSPKEISRSVGTASIQLTLEGLHQHGKQRAAVRKPRAHSPTESRELRTMRKLWRHSSDQERAIFRKWAETACAKTNKRKFYTENGVNHGTCSHEG